MTQVKQQTLPVNIFRPLEITVLPSQSGDGCERTAPLVELREQHLKDALVSAGNSVGTLLAGSDAPGAPPELGRLPHPSVSENGAVEERPGETVELDVEDEILDLLVEDGSSDEELAEC